MKTMLLMLNFGFRAREFCYRIAAHDFFGGEQRGMNRRFFDGSGRDV
jgi:hypothetical protein